jgi:hypothetical protein
VIRASFGRPAAALLTAAVLMLAAACGSSAPSGGFVRAKRSTPAYATWDCQTVGHNPCVPVPHYHPQTWSIDVDNGGGQHWIDVDRATYDRLAIGDYWTASPST